MEPLDPVLWRDLIGKPFAHRGRGPDSYDCFGLLLEVYRRRGIIILDSSYGDTLTQRSTEIVRRLVSWRRSTIYPGVALLFREGGVAGHVGVAIDDDRFIHASERTGQVVVGFLSRGWLEPLIGSYVFTQD